MLLAARPIILVCSGHPLRMRIDHYHAPIHAAYCLLDKQHC